MKTITPEQKIELIEKFQSRLSALVNAQKFPQIVMVPFYSYGHIALSPISATTVSNAINSNPKNHAKYMDEWRVEFTSDGNVQFIFNTDYMYVYFPVDFLNDESKFNEWLKKFAISTEKMKETNNTAESTLSDGFDLYANGSSEEILWFSAHRFEKYCDEWLELNKKPLNSMTKEDIWNFANVKDKLISEIKCALADIQKSQKFPFAVHLVKDREDKDGFVRSENWIIRSKTLYEFFKHSTNIEITVDTENIILENKNMKDITVPFPFRFFNQEEFEKFLENSKEETSVKEPEPESTVDESSCKKNPNPTIKELFWNYCKASLANTIGKGFCGIDEKYADKKFNEAKHDFLSAVFKRFLEIAEVQGNPRVVIVPSIDDNKLVNGYGELESIFHLFENFDDIEINDYPKLGPGFLTLTNKNNDKEFLEYPLSLLDEKQFETYKYGLSNYCPKNPEVARLLKISPFAKMQNNWIQKGKEYFNWKNS